MDIIFSPLTNFKSKEFKGTQYVKGMTYTLKDGNKLLKDMVSKWAVAQLFEVLEEVSILDIAYKVGDTSYALDDSFADIVKVWESEGKVKYLEGGLITFNTPTPTSKVTGG